MDNYILIFIILLLFIFTCSIRYSDTFSNKKNINVDLYDKVKCLDCIKRQKEFGNRPNDKLFCVHCGSEHRDVKCAPGENYYGYNLNKTKKPSNCISKKISYKEAVNMCTNLSSNYENCVLYSPNSKYRTKYMNKECGEDYYCAYDINSSCSMELCNLSGPNKYYNPNSHCICTRPNTKEGLPHAQGGLPDDIGRICKLKNCKSIDFQQELQNPLAWQAEYKNKWNNTMPLAYTDLED